MTEFDERPKPLYSVGDTLTPRDDRASIPEFTFKITHPGQIQWIDLMNGYAYTDQPIGGIGFLESELTLVDDERAEDHDERDTLENPTQEKENN